ncbi:MAG: hypothetical protein R3F56_06975 [Planctomycetota bacterium]
MSCWLPLDLEARSLGDERLQLHAGALALASVAHALLPHAEDDAHTNFAVDARGDTEVLALRTWPLRQHPEQHASLAVADLELRWHRGAEIAARLPLPGRTLAEAHAWADSTARRLCGAAVQPRRYEDLPPHPLFDGGAFTGDRTAARAELGCWFANAAALFGELATREPALSPARVWPHHFDLGVLLPVTGTAAAATIGLGFSPGDSHYAEPYFYCSPYGENAAALPPLSGPGEWHTTDFTSVIVTGTELLAGGHPQRQARAWLASALSACRRVVGTG